MIEIFTERLRMISLSPDHLRLLSNDQKQLEINLSLHKSKSNLSQELKRAMEVRLSKALTDEQNYIWYTNWIIVPNNINEIVGGIMLKGTPNHKGEVVIGYYTHPEHQGYGYMTEAINGMKNWLLNQTNVRYVVADTEKDNIASHRVLEKTGAELYQETEELFYWRFA
ncbi:GNAT family N-acetyltransferase [Fictibacillus phosphorivorans]|uniref:GNAT family N-acetyltransferase n=1 Tax=Fictibacillus phosphorivorans TaxID=1221500 RepID=UPI001293ED96|nr:GNAT family N-acetyltransferase [Fictibacillus phosphorivorans]MQR94365.1 N-acetyltransferase [Fictibacillus phosphorivorans]